MSGLKFLGSVTDNNHLSRAGRHFIAWRRRLVTVGSVAATTDVAAYFLNVRM